MSEAEIILNSIYYQLDEYYDSPRFNSIKEGEKLTDDFLAELKSKFDKLTDIKLTSKQQKKKNQLYKHYIILGK